jgi:hypothetical protein
VKKAKAHFVHEPFFLLKSAFSGKLILNCHPRSQGDATKMIKIIYFFKKYWREICVAMLAAGFFVAASVFIGFTQASLPEKWASPDETANYVFAKLYGQTGGLTIFEKYNLAADDIMAPRSMRSDGGQIKPVSFLGIILIYGGLAKFFSFRIFPYLTPFFAALGIFFYYLLIKKVFTPKIAFLSVFLLASFPVMIFYSVRSLFHNVLFVSFLTIGSYLIVLAATRPPAKNDFLSRKIWQMDWLNLLLSALGGLAIGAALITRTSEVIWLLPALLILWIFNIKKIGFLKLIVFLAFAALPFVPVMAWNQILYGGFFNGGYTEMNRSIDSIAAAGVDLTKTVSAGQFAQAVEPLAKIKNNIFYFGIKPAQAESAFKNYFIKMFPLLFWPAFLGLILFLSRVWKWKKKHWAYLAAYFVASAILVLYYGSWDFHDNPNPNEITIGNSYTRYWLPVFLGAMPFAAFFISRFSWAIFARENEDREAEMKIGSSPLKDFFRPQPPGRNFSIGALQTVIIILIAFFSFNFLMIGSKEGLAYTGPNNQTLKLEYAEVMKLTEPSAVIITRYHDKLFFPERKVIVGALTDDQMNLRYKKLVNLLPVYYYNFTFPAKDFQYLNDDKLKQAGLILKKIKTTDDVFTLYKLENCPPEIPTSTPVFAKKSLTNLKIRDKNK